MSRLLLGFLALAVLPGWADDWPRFLGPHHDAKSAETGFAVDQAPRLLWSCPKGRSHTAPSVVGDRVVLAHLREGEETVDCLEAATGKRLWRHTTPVTPGQSYGIDDAPRSGPVIDGDLVHVCGFTGELVCLRLGDGSVVWKKNLDREYGKAPFFFARGSCPLVWKNQLIVNVGSKPCVAGFDKGTGELLWGVDHPWNASYASPVPAILHGRERVLVFAGGMSDPPNGGLLVIDPEKRRIESEFPWRATNFASVNAASPVVVGDGVFLTEGYGPGGVLLQFAPATMEPSVRWEAPGFSAQFSTPVLQDGLLFGFSGASESRAELVCQEVASGRELWRDGNPLEVEFEGRRMRVFLGRGSLLAVDGKLLGIGEQGTLVWLAPDRTGMKVLGISQLLHRPETWGIPALAGGRLYVGENNGEDSRLHCFLLPKR
ncbi:MAG: PQQ-binding-like beta-propeller repeat protein [Verrucomicrobia bacterium]|nr:PQQ-binding-like beta-propeller repeat protein [Verrucomicrobiota bacterium]